MLHGQENLSPLEKYARRLAAKNRQRMRSGEIFAKVLAPNDDSGRHGVVIPNDAYAFFPAVIIRNRKRNQTESVPVFDALLGKRIDVAYKYYQRYPERRITRLNPLLNRGRCRSRILVFLRANHLDGSSGYYVDCATSGRNGRFRRLYETCFGNRRPAKAGGFVMKSLDAPRFVVDTNLAKLLTAFDKIRRDGWIPSKRKGDTGIGYTFESLLGIEENNNKRADFNGIEIKCKGVKEGMQYAHGKISLFQQAPVWHQKHGAAKLIRMVGTRGNNGLFSCHSQLTTGVNNLGLALGISDRRRKVDLRKHRSRLGYWPYRVLQQRLSEKHSRAAIVKAAVRRRGDRARFYYNELIYCERPTIARFVELLRNRNIVFEFLMSEKTKGKVRNHGYPWRLVRDEVLGHLFSFQIKLR